MKSLPMERRLCSGAFPNCAGVGARTNTFSFSAFICPVPPALFANSTVSD